MRALWTLVGVWGAAVIGAWLAFATALVWAAWQTPTPLRCGACDTDLGKAPIRETSDGCLIVCPSCRARHVYEPDPSA